MVVAEIIMGCLQCWQIKNAEKLVHAECDIKPFVHSYFMHQVYLQLCTENEIICLINYMGKINFISSSFSGEIPFSK